MPIVLNGSTGNISASSLTGVTTGKVLQVVQKLKTDTASLINTTTFTDISGLSQAITISASSKVRIGFDCTWSTDGGYSAMFRLVRIDADGSTVYPYLGDTNGSRTRSSFGGFGSASSYNMEHSQLEFLDTPSGAGTHTYKIQWQTGYTSNHVWLNRDKQGTNGATRASTPSSLILTEVAA
jgi:hypothetical protein